MLWYRNLIKIGNSVNCATDVYPAKIKGVEYWSENFTRHTGGLSFRLRFVHHPLQKSIH